MRLLSLIAAVVGASCVSAAMDRHFPGRETLPAHWMQVNAPVARDHHLKLRVALFPRDAKTLEATLLDVGTPGSQRFRQYLKKDQITAMVGRSESEIDSLREFFASYGLTVTSVHPHRDWVFVEGSAAAVEKAFQCELGHFQHKIREDDTRIAALKGYSIPAPIAHLVNFVAGMTTFSFSHWSASSALSLGDDATLPITPQTIYDKYQVPNGGAHGAKRGSQAVLEFGKFANFNDKDLQQFFKEYQPALVGETVGMVLGENDGTMRPSVEANLDVQYMMASAPFVNTTDYKIVSSKGIEDQFLDYTILVNSQNEPPLVHSISYGEYGGTYDNVTDQQFSYELQKMGLSGVSVLLASGDNGVGCNADGTSQEFDYPSSPYLTMVGATQIDAKSGSEIGATLSSGGFSKDFMRATWQDTAVSAYLSSPSVTLPNEAYYAAGRAYPDVAAFGQNVQVVASGKTQSVAGTSCSAPIFGGIVSLLNDELLAQGLAPLGWLNPWLYANPQMFTDVTLGSNPYQKCKGFTASTGWDPVTGLGTPLYQPMRAAAFAAVGRTATEMK